MYSSQPVVSKCLEIPRFGCLPKPLQKRTVWWSFWTHFCVLWGGVHKASNVRTCQFKYIQLYRLENVGVKEFFDPSQPIVPKSFEIPRFGCLPKPLQNQTVRWSFSALFCVLWGGVRKGSNVRKCKFKHIQLHRLENVGLKAFLDSSQPVVPKCFEIPRFGCLPKPLQKRMVW